MSEELNLVTQLAIILIAAGIFTVISKALKQPLILGYIVAGFIVGPNLGLLPQFSPESVHEWSELGIIFLLFGLGLEFSFKKLLNVGSTAMIAAGTICIGMFIAGNATGSALGWTQMESIFLGGMMSMSSTTIIIKAYDDLGIKHKPYANIVFGLLVVEDLIAVLIMVLLSTLAVSNQFSGTEMLISLGKLVLFLVLCFLIGIFVIPTLFKKAKKYLSDEILLLVSVGICFLMVILANLAGFSSALGAFLMGSILSSTIEGEHIERLTSDIKNLFGAIFFVSVGMMVDPSVIAAQWQTILIITVVAMAGILIFSTAGILFAGKDLDTAIHVGFSLPQLGEFSFIIAGLGCSLGVVREFIYPLVISVSVITTFTTPYMIKASDPVSAWLHDRLPASVLDKLKGRQHKYSSKAEENQWKLFAKQYFLRIGIYSLILIAILLGAKAFLPSLTDRLFHNMDEFHRKLIELAVLLTVMSPFLYGLAINGGEARVISNRILQKNPDAKFTLMTASMFRIILAVLFIVSSVTMMFNLKGWILILIWAGLIGIFIYARNKSETDSSRIERIFFKNLNEKEELEKKKAPVANLVKKRFAGYDIHIESVKVPQNSCFAGMKFIDLPFRQETGVNIIKIRRGEKDILIPTGEDVIYPGDTLLAVGTSSQIDLFSKLIHDKVEKNTASDTKGHFTVEPVTLGENSELNGKLLKETDMRSNGCMVISVEHNGMTITNPKPDYCFCTGDIVWIAGPASSVEWYK